MAPGFNRKTAGSLLSETFCPESEIRLMKFLFSVHENLLKEWRELRASRNRRKVFGVLSHEMVYDYKVPIMEGLRHCSIEHHKYSFRIAGQVKSISKALLTSPLV